MRWFRGRKNSDGQEERIPLRVDSGGYGPDWVLPSEVVDSLRYLITRVSLAQPLPSRIALVAAQRGEGVTFLTQALGAVMAHDLETSVAIVSLNWWWPSSVPSSASAYQKKGLANVLAGEEALDGILMRTGWDNLTLVPAGVMPQVQRPVAARSSALSALMCKLNEEFDHLILDIPAVLATSDAIPLAKLSEACCVVVHQGVTPLNQVRRAIKELPDVPILGVIMNCTETVTPSRILKLIPQI